MALTEKDLEAKRSNTFMSLRAHSSKMHLTGFVLKIFPLSTYFAWRMRIHHVQYTTSFFLHLNHIFVAVVIQLLLLWVFKMSEVVKCYNPAKLFILLFKSAVRHKKIDTET